MSSTRRLPLAEPPVVLAATVNGLRASVLRWLPNSAFRTFYLRMLDPAAEAHASFVQLAAIAQLANLTSELLNGLADTPRQADHLLSASMLMNAWQVHEVVSDNLALGLGHPAALDDAEEAARRALLRTFNLAMCGRLRGEGCSMTTPFRELAHGKVAFGRSSLVPAVHAALIAQFAEASGISGGEVEASAPDQLVANIESCIDMLDGMTCAPLAEAARASLLSRYEGVNELLSSPDLTFDRLLAIGTHTILVLPTLAFYVDALTACLGVTARLTPVVEDRSLIDALATAATLVRLLNDIGTNLLTAAPAQRQDLLRAIRNAIAEAPDDLALVNALPREIMANPALTRLRKDIEHDEFNLLLHGIGHRGPVREMIDTFEARLARAASEYSSAKRRLNSLLDRLDQRMADERPGLLVRRFVGFHERLYRNAYDSRSGEYAIA
jgi:hypothetical protein